MTHRLLAGLCVSALIGSTVFAQAPAAPPAAPPGAGRGGGQGGRGGPVKSPEVSADGRVTFRLRAPNATQAAVSLGGRQLPMEKNDQGIWTATSDALAPDFYTYSLVVDGASMNDPSNRQVQTSFGSFQSMVVVPGPKPWLPSPTVPHGAITRHSYHSAIAGDDREFYVYTPPGYDARRPQAYPVVYLLHGLGDDAERWMTGGGGAHHILDNLIAEKKAVPMVLVTPLGYGTSTGPTGGRTAENITNYAKILLTEVMPSVDRSYNVTKNRNERAIAGLSMGGAETLFVGLNNLDRFAWIAAFSSAPSLWPEVMAMAPAPPATPAAPGGGRGAAAPAPPLDPVALTKTFPKLDAKANAQIRMLWIVCGTSDGLITANREFKSWLKSKQVAFTEQEVPDMAHVWPLWRQNFTDFAEKVFVK